MTPRSLFRVGAFLVPALFALPLMQGCSGQSHSVGTNTQSTGETADPCNPGGSVICAEPNVPVGCHLGAASCVNGQYQCPPVVCSGDAGSCSGQSEVCSEPAIPVGCHLGPPGCIDGAYQCPPVVCPPDDGGDVGTCSGQGVVCSEPAIPVG